MSESFADYGIDTKGRSGNIKTSCPKCGPDRARPNDPCLSVSTEAKLWKCHRCSFSGKLGVSSGMSHQTAYRRPSFEHVPMIHPMLIEWAGSRGIEAVTLERAKINIRRKYFPQLQGEASAIQFPYFRGGECVNIKSRAIEEKAFTQESGAEKIFYGLDDIEGAEWVLIVEGEMDKLAFAQAGVLNCLSVPDGAPPEGSKASDKKFEYIPNCEKELSQVKRIILAVDRDGPGKTLEAELARRLGPERCYTIQWPDGCKDANDVLMRDGRHALTTYIETAKMWPIAGIVEPYQLMDELEQLYQEGKGRGVSTGWIAVDQYYTVAIGEMTIVTGIPGHGKSEWIDALMVNLCQWHEWRVGICSPENFPIAGHVSKLLEKYTGKPFREGRTTRMGWAELGDGMQWLQDHAVFFNPGEDCINIDEVLRLAKISVSRYGIQGLVIDPWNEFEHERERGQSETEYIGAMLSKIRRFARSYAVHVWVVAHPMKMKKEGESYPVPTPYDINGSANWRNKADNCVTIYRDATAEDTRAVQVHIQKIRFRQNGKIGMTEMMWNPLNGRYS